MKTNVTKTQEFKLSVDMLNEKKALKYVGKEQMLSLIVELQVELAKLNAMYTPHQYTKENNKEELFKAYGRMAVVYTELKKKRDEETAKNVKELIAPVKPVKPVVKTEPKPAKEVITPGVTVLPNKTAMKKERNDAQERLDKYSAELKEKEAIKEPTKEDIKRIASLKRKIERATRALKIQK